jgi:hypothetical protein
MQTAATTTSSAVQVPGVIAVPVHQSPHPQPADAFSARPATAATPQSGMSV